MGPPGPPAGWETCAATAVLEGPSHRRAFFCDPVVPFLGQYPREFSTGVLRGRAHHSSFVAAELESRKVHSWGWLSKMWQIPRWDTTKLSEWGTV